MDSEYRHTAYGLRLDGTIGPEEPGNPVAAFAVVSTDGPRDFNGLRYQWSDGTFGPVKRPGALSEAK